MTYTIKPLEWKPYTDSDSKVHMLTAETIFSQIRVIREGEVWAIRGENLKQSSLSMDAAIAAAEQWYRDRLAPALEEVK